MNMTLSRFAVSMVLVLGCSAPVWGGTPSAKSDARPDFYSGRRVGIKTTIVVKSAGQDSGSGVCQCREVADDASFRGGDSFRVRLESNAAGYLYVVANSRKNHYKLLSPGTDAKSVQVGKFGPVYVPLSGWFHLSKTADEDFIYFIVSNKKIEQFEKSDGSADLNDELLDRLDERAAGMHSMSFGGDKGGGHQFAQASPVTYTFVQAAPDRDAETTSIVVWRVEITRGHHGESNQ